MLDDIQTRELPDGGHEIVLEDPVLACIVVDDSVTLQFGRTTIAIVGEFGFEADDVEYRLDTRVPDSLGPLLTAYPGSARWLWAAPTGTLTLVFIQGQRVVVPEPVVHRSWSIGTISTPGSGPE